MSSNNSQPFISSSNQIQSTTNPTNRSSYESCTDCHQQFPVSELTVYNHPTNYSVLCHRCASKRDG